MIFIYTRSSQFKDMLSTKRKFEFDIALINSTGYIMSGKVLHLELYPSK